MSRPLFPLFASYLRFQYICSEFLFNLLLSKSVVASFSFSIYFIFYIIWCYLSCPRCLGNATHTYILPMTHTHINYEKLIMEEVRDPICWWWMGNIVKNIFQDMVYRMMMMINFHICENYYILCFVVIGENIGVFLVSYG